MGQNFKFTEAKTERECPKTPSALIIAINIQQSNSASIALFLMTKDFIYATFSAFLIE